MAEWYPYPFPPPWRVAHLAPHATGWTTVPRLARDALRAAGGPPSSEPDGPLLIAVNDPDRTTATEPALAALRAAAPNRPFRVLVATGTHLHSAGVRQEHEALLVAAAGPPVEVHWHAGDEDASVDVAGVRADPLLADARDVVAIGSVEPHWFAGVTGAYKTLAIGLAARSQIERSHRRAVEPGVRPLCLEGNPAHAAIRADCESLMRGRAVLALQHLGPHWEAGDPIECAERMLGAARACWRRTVPAPLDFFVARIRAPLDRSLYQAEKGLKNSEFAVRDGGAIVLDAICTDGVGPSRFVEVLAHGTAGVEEYRLGDHKALRLLELRTRGVSLGLLAAAFPEEAARHAGIDLLHDEDAAVHWLRQKLPEHASGAVVEDAAHTVVEVAA